MQIPPDTWYGSYGEKLGIVYTITEPGHAEAELELRPEHCNPNGVCHGGALFTFADDGTGAALHAMAPAGHVPTSNQANIHFARSARAGDRLRVMTHVLSHGQRTAVVEARVVDAQDRLIALLTSSCMFVPARPTV